MTLKKAPKNLYCAHCGNRVAKSKATIKEGYFGPQAYCPEPICQERSADPVPVKIDSRICFGINYYATEAEAQRAAELVRAAGHTYNGGYMHGVPCGREPAHDYIDKASGQKLYAVTN